MHRLSGLCSCAWNRQDSGLFILPDYCAGFCVDLVTTPLYPLLVRTT
jgi:hypothetical protein